MQSEQWSAGSVAEQAFDRINQSVSITIASYATDILEKHASWDIITITCLIIFVVSGQISVPLSTGYFQSADDTVVQSIARPLIMLRSVIGIVTTTTVMKHLNDLGSSFSVGDPDNTSSSSASILIDNSSWKTPHLVSVVLSVSFVMMADTFRKITHSNHEASAIFTGIQYAFSDIILSSVQSDRPVKYCLAMIFVLAGHLLYDSIDSPETKLTMTVGTLASTTVIVGSTIVIDSIMPLSLGNPVEDIARACITVLLVCSTKSMVGENASAHTQQQTGGNKQRGKAEMADAISSFAIWRVARRFNTILQKYVGPMELVVSMGALLAFFQWIKSRVGGVVAGILMDVTALLIIYIVSQWVVQMTDRGSSSDAFIMLVVCSVTVREFMKLMMH